MSDLIHQLSTELAIHPDQVAATIRLFDENATVPFIARYRKSLTQGLETKQLRQLHTRLSDLRELENRRDKALNALRQQNQLTEWLDQRIRSASSKAELEEIYAPYRLKRTSQSFKAIEAGLYDIAQTILNEPVDPNVLLQRFDHPDYPDLESRINGVQHIIWQQWSQNIDLTIQLKHQLTKTAILQSQLITEDKREVGQKYQAYFNHEENLAKIPSYRLFALLRGRQDNVLVLKLKLDDRCALRILEREYPLDTLQPDPRQEFLRQTLHLYWKNEVYPRLEHTLLTEKRREAESQAIATLAENLRHLLMTPPVGSHSILGIDATTRDTVKLAVIDSAGDVIAYDTVYPLTSSDGKPSALDTVQRLCQIYQIHFIAISNGTASHAIDQLITIWLNHHKALNLTKVTVHGAGITTYSTSELASIELEDLDVSLRGAVSIARRLQNPLAEFVKVDPKILSLGQYQNDVNQDRLTQALQAVIEDCVNAVGADINTASSAYLSYISGLNLAVAQQIVDYRRIHGDFSTLEQLKNVPRFGHRTFDQAAGFLRLLHGDQPLDQSTIHPKYYSVVESIAQQQGCTVNDLMTNQNIIQRIEPKDFVNDHMSFTTIQDIIEELKHPSKDPRPPFRPVQFRRDITDITDLQIGLEFEGIITHITHFGAFVDIGIPQRGLIHISDLSSEFVDDPYKIVKPGQIVQVAVIQIDLEQKRINLSLKLNQVTHHPHPQQAIATKPVVDINAEVISARTKPSHTHSAKSQRKGSTRHHPSQQSFKQPDQAKDRPKIGTLGALLLQAGMKDQSTE